MSDDNDAQEPRPVGRIGPGGTPGPADEADSAPAEGPAGEPGPAASVSESPRGGGLRVLGAVITLPWLILYGITGAWAIARGARAAAEGLKQFDAGYTRFVTPAEVMFIGALLLAAFAVMMACALLLLFGRRSATVWLPLLLVAAGLTAGSVWASARGGLHPILWVTLFFGLVYVTVVALVGVLKVTRAQRRGRIVSP